MKKSLEPLFKIKLSNSDGLIHSNNKKIIHNTINKMGWKKRETQ
jgi:hypothetical protein